jgi:hypothetical protein
MTSCPTLGFGFSESILLYEVSPKKLKCHVTIIKLNFKGTKNILPYHYKG